MTTPPARLVRAREKTMLEQSVLSATEQAKSSKPALFPKAPNMKAFATSTERPH